MTRIVKIDVASAAKVGGVFAILIGLLASPAFLLWAIAYEGADTLSLGTGMVVLCGLVFVPGIAGFYGIAGGALFAWIFNLTSKVTGGLALELQPPQGEHT